jgi:hypothetical protein
MKPTKEQRTGKDINDRTNMLIGIISVLFAFIIFLSCIIVFNN